MKREIKFRGRNKNGEWLYGDILQVAKHSFIAPSDGDWFDFIPWKKDNVFHMPHSQYVVNTDTIGQYTGLKDKDGKEIYEGDIVKNMNNKTGCITFLQQEMGFVIVWSNSDTRLGHRSRGSGYDFDMTLEVIGNIYDNPELLKGGEE